MEQNKYPDPVACPFFIEATRETHLGPNHRCLVTETFPRFKVNSCKGINDKGKPQIQFIHCSDYTRGIIGVTEKDISEILIEFRTQSKEALNGVRDRLVDRLTQK